MAFSFNNLVCGPKQSRRYLLLVNVVTGIVGFILLGVGSFSLETGSRIKDDILNVFCEDQCRTDKCGLKDCSVNGCDCSITPGVSTLSTEFFTAPAAGMAAVGFLSMVASVIGCMAASRTHPIWLALYILFIAILIILQFAFGVAAAVLGNVPTVMTDFFSANYQKMDWKLLQMVLPPSCWASETTDQWGDNFHPACNWDGTCDPKLSDDVMTKYQYTCCDASNMCASQEMCTTPSHCIVGLLQDIGAPVAVAALLTIFLQFLAIWWAWNVRKETKAGGVFDKDRMRA